MEKRDFTACKRPPKLSNHPNRGPRGPDPKRAQCPPTQTMETVVNEKKNERRIEIFHTSPDLITKINNIGLFGEFLCFSGHVYVMTAGSCYITYKIEIDEDDLIAASQLFYHADAAKLDGLVNDIASRYDIDTDIAEALLDESGSGWDIIDAWDADDSFFIQKCTARAAKILGYRGAIMTDEQGALYMIDMLGHEDELEIVGDMS